MMTATYDKTQQSTKNTINTLVVMVVVVVYSREGGK